MDALALELRLVESFAILRFSFPFGDVVEVETEGLGVFRNPAVVEVD